ncbi:MAG: GNAT family protein [Saprospiraceae bacterium]|nr:GNAT family N-acetyltransferase [Saprospiraceae bacterium]MCB9345241.1 GNAT family N-acetyltransferase [Lewinellaceae bacterium]
MQTVREIRSSDIDLIIHYWVTADTEYLRGMGADINKLPSPDELRQMLHKQTTQAYADKKAYCIIWELDGVPVGHCNVNKIIYGEEAYMHLHLWQAQNRRSGLGLEFVRMTLPYFFRNMKLQRLYAEPFAANPAPNKTLARLGFRFLKTYTTTPGSINFEQEVNLWVLDA